MLLYDFPEAYDLLFTPDFRQATMNYFKILFKNRKIRDVLDCSCGTGQMTIPLAQIGLKLTGSDINPKMLNKAKKNSEAEDLDIDYYKADFRKLVKAIKGEFDLVMNTGNSLAHIPNKDLSKALLSMDAVLRPGGIMYIDSRNWDIIQKRKQRFYLTNPIIRDKGRVNMLQVWDYLKDGSMVFNYLFSEEIENKIVSKRQFYTVYHPFKIKELVAILESMDYQKIRITKLGDPTFEDVNKIDWYTITAVKPIPELLERNRK